MTTPNHESSEVLPTKPMVLCITRNTLKQFNIPIDGFGMYPIDLSLVHPNDFHFLNRHVVDNKEINEFKEIGYLLPQILPYITVTDGNGKYLSYSRNGTETRLHGSLSLGVGGHVDFDDFITGQNGQQNIYSLIQQSCIRELAEEISLNKAEAPALKLDRVIVDTTNAVGKVHLGFYSLVTYPNAIPQEELFDARWLTLDQLSADIDRYENWSKIVINNLLQQASDINR